MSGASILVVDDDPQIRAVVPRILIGAGFSVRTAASGEDCLAMFRGGFRGLVFMDVMMPGLSGWDTIAAMRSEGLSEGVLVCMLTGRQDPDPPLDELKECVLGYLRKPFTQKEIIGQAREFLALLE
jgi:CheY-like chemotaxis protein